MRRRRKNGICFPPHLSVLEMKLHPEDAFELFLNYFTSARAGCMGKPEGLLDRFVIVRAGSGPLQRQLETFPAPFSHSFETFAQDGFSSTNCVPFEQSAKLFFYICSLPPPCPLNNSPSFWSICHRLFPTLQIYTHWYMSLNAETLTRNDIQRNASLLWLRKYIQYIYRTGVYICRCEMLVFQNGKNFTSRFSTARINFCTCPPRQCRVYKFAITLSKQRRVVKRVLIDVRVVLYTLRLIAYELVLLFIFIRLI